VTVFLVGQQRSVDRLDRALAFIADRAAANA
jgi:hypothetical protein